jgi:hypothetical protein
MYNIDRKTASRLLKVSMRTVDRYIVAKKLSIEKKEGRIWLDKKEVLKIRNADKVDNAVDMSTAKMSIDKLGSTPVDMSIDTVQLVSTPKFEKQRAEGYAEERVYKKLFEELQQELKIKQERLEGANYRVGQLESLVKDSVPRLDYQKVLQQGKIIQEELQQHLKAEQGRGEVLQVKLKEEKYDKRIYLVLLFIILLLQPLWLFLSMGN